MKRSKQALLHSAIALLLCISMFVSTTFAWFTDSVTSQNNLIVSGNLDAELEWRSPTGQWLSVNENTNVFEEGVLWEPGHTEVVYLRVSNKGSLAFKYQLGVNVASETQGTNVYGEKFQLSDHIWFGMITKDVDEIYLDRDSARQDVTNPVQIRTGLSKPGSMEAGNPNLYQYITLVVYMPESVGNEANYKTGTNPPVVNLGITLVASQYTSESDSFGPDYDQNAQFPVLKPGNVAVDITGKVDANSLLTEDVQMVNDAGNLAAIVPAGTKVTGNSLSLRVSELSATGSNVQLQENEILRPLDVHIDGIAADNTVPARITVKEAMMTGLNIGNYALYHVEGNDTNAMTPNDLTVHNGFTYDPATGDLTLAMKSFSEVAVIADTEKAWEGKFDYTWYDASKTELTIANADQLAAFGAIVGDMDGQTRDSFAGKTVKLIADINLGDKNNENESLIFHPIGYYYTDDKNEDGTTGDYYSTVYSFEGTFDGNGHNIANFYQNTWEIKGDYDGNYYSDAMGLFGYVVGSRDAEGKPTGGIIKNLTVDNFSSDGEFTPTGVIAAYAVNATFENIAITNCNPRVYNTGNGGIVGIGGNSNDPDTYKLTFTNITIDNTNKITALWGSWDVACGGLIGMFRGAGHVYMKNCHVGAQIDVYNDVCGNYQYYWYRYSGMMIGTNKNMVTDKDGYTVPETSKFHAENCTVHFGDWNDYYYCELVANSLASYTHDHQFSRLEQISSLDEIKSGDTWTKTGNFLLINGDTKTCYHIVKNADGTLKRHLHTDAGEETVDGKTVPKEDNQIIYLPFNQLFTGYGWGVKHIPVYNGKDYAFKGITILDREVANSVEKFKGKDKVTELTNNKEYKLGDIFVYIDNCGVDVVDGALSVTITNLDEKGNVIATFTRGKTWSEGTISFENKGKIAITIQDYYFCTPTTITVDVTDRQPEVKFDVVMNNGDFLHRVGNSGTVALDKLFKAKDGVTVGTVSVTVEAVNGTAAFGTYSNNAIQFSGTGVVKVTITDNDYCIPTELYLEVVDATNVTGLSGTISGNVVLLNDCGLSSLTVSGRNTVYGNGFTATYTGNGQYLNNGLKQGVVTVSENGMLDNLRIVAPIYPKAYLYYEQVQGGPSSTEGDKTRYHYQLSAVVAKGNATISNCYIYGGRNNIFIDTGDVTVKDTVLECAPVANVQIQSNSSHTVIFENVTTIQYQVNATIGDTAAVMMGAGIVVGPETNDNPTIVLNGGFKQYNWITKDDANSVTDKDYTQSVLNAALGATAYNHTVNGKTASNAGIIYMNTLGVRVENKTGLPYAEGRVEMNFSGINISGKVYSLQNATEGQIYSDYENADKSTVNSLYQPQFKYDDDLGGQYIEKDSGDEHFYCEGDTVYVMFPSGDTKELDLAALVNIVKYTGQNLGLVVTCKDSQGTTVAVADGKVTLSTADVYTLTYTVTDTLFYDKDGSTVSDTKRYSWNVTLNVSLKDTASPNARFEFDSTKQKMGYYKPTIGDVKQYLPFLAGLKIYDYNGQTEYLRFDGSSDFNKVASITITGYESNKALVEIKLTDGGVINTRFLSRANSGGGSTYTGKIKTSNNTVYFVTDSGTSNKESTTTAAYWHVDYYKFTGNNGVTIQSGQQTFNSTGSSASTPSGNFGTTIKYTVNYDGNGGNCGQTTSYATSASAAVTLPTPTRSGYIFAGWYTVASGGDRVGGAGESYTPSANVTLYAQWGKPCTVTYNANGGSCGTVSEKYTGTTLTLPTPTRDGYWFIGWYDAATGGNKIGDAGATYNPAGEITLYAHWQEKVEYTVTYNANGGTCGTASATYQGTVLTLPTPTRPGYKFLGWYTATSGGTKIGEAGASYTPSANITLYAQWQINSYTITVTTNNATVKVNGTTVNNNGTVSIQYGTQVTVEVTYSQSNSRSTTIKGSDGTTYTSPFTMPAQDVTINATSSGSCVTSDTLVTLADGTQKRIDQITYTDQLLVWDFYRGQHAVVPAAIIFDHGYDYNTVIKLNFSDGTSVKVVNLHQFFDADLNKFVSIDAESVADYVGHKFVKQNGEDYELVTLVDYTSTEEYCEAWGIISAEHYNIIVEGMLSADFMKEDFALFNYFQVGQNMKFDEVQMQAEIEKYGLYTYADFEQYLTREQFEAFNVQYFKIAVGKGEYTYEGILALIETYLKN